MSRPVTACAAAVKGCWHWLWQKLSWAGVETVTWMTPPVSCRGTIWSNQTRLRLGWLCRTFCRIRAQVVGSRAALSRALLARRDDAGAFTDLVTAPPSRAAGDWVVNMASCRVFRANDLTAT